VVAYVDVGGGVEANLDRAVQVAVAQHRVVVDRRARRVPGEDGGIRVGGPGGAVQAGGHVHEVVGDGAAGVVVARRVQVEAEGDGPVHVDEGVALDGGVGGVVPDQDGGVPQVGVVAVGNVEVLEEVVADDPPVAVVDVDAVGVAQAAAVVGGGRTIQV